MTYKQSIYCLLATSLRKMALIWPLYIYFQRISYIHISSSQIFIKNSSIFLTVGHFLMIGNASSYWQYRQKYSTIYEKDVSPTFYLLSAILTYFIKAKFRYCHGCRRVKQNDLLQVIGDFFWLCNQKLLRVVLQSKIGYCGQN